jgi:hypothetical protein
MNEVAIGSGLNDKVEQLIHIPVMREPGQAYRKCAEYDKYVALPANDSKAVDEITQWKAFKTRVDRAYDYATGVRTYEVDDENQKPPMDSLRMIKYVFMAACVITGAALLYFKLWGG